MDLIIFLTFLTVLGRNAENDAAGWYLLMSLDKLLKDRNELHDKTDEYSEGQQ